MSTGNANQIFSLLGGTRRNGCDVLVQNGEFGGEVFGRCQYRFKCVVVETGELYHGKIIHQ